jgi:hypothetical protein
MSGKANNPVNLARRMHGEIPPTLLPHDESYSSLHAPVLVLNASYEPINVCAARRAIVLVLKGIAMAEEENGHHLHAARLAFRVPSVIRLLEYRRIRVVRCRERIFCFATGILASTVLRCCPRAS